MSQETAEEKPGEENVTAIDSRSNIRISVGVAASLAAGIAIAFYWEVRNIYIHIDERAKQVEERLREINASIDTKADKGTTQDRYTRSDAARDFNNEQQGDLLQQQFTIERIEHVREVLQVQIDNIKESSNAPSAKPRSRANND